MWFGWGLYCSLSFFCTFSCFKTPFWHMQQKQCKICHSDCSNSLWMTSTTKQTSQIPFRDILSGSDEVWIRFVSLLVLLLHLSRLQNAILTHAVKAVQNMPFRLLQLALNDLYFSTDLTDPIKGQIKRLWCGLDQVCIAPCPSFARFPVWKRHSDTCSKSSAKYAIPTASTRFQWPLLLNRPHTSH